MKTELEIFTELRHLEILEANSYDLEYASKLRQQIKALQWTLGLIESIND